MKTSTVSASLALFVASVALAGPALAADTAKKKAAEGKVAAAPAVRDWAEVDTDKDGLISPEEMERYLAAKPGPLAQK